MISGPSNPKTELDRLKLLSDRLPNLRDKDRKFASDLLDSYRHWNRLSLRQWEWVDILTARAVPLETKSEAEARISGGIEIPNFDRVEAMLRKAQGVVQFPRIWIVTKFNLKILLTPLRNRTGVRVRYDGHYAACIYDNIMVPDQNVTFNMEAVAEALKAFAADPRQMAKDYGVKTSTCCFCGLGLINKNSVAMGYGPICAENYGLPWGQEVTEKKLTTAAIEEFDRMLKN